MEQKIECLKIQTNLVFTGMFNFLGFKLDSKQALFHS